MPLPRLRAIYESQQNPCQPELMAYFLRTDPGYADAVFHRHPWNMQAAAPCAWEYFSFTPKLRMHAVLEKYLTAYLMHGDVRLKMAAAELGSPEPTIDLGLCKVSAVGVGMRSNSGVAATMFDALAGAGVRIANITTSEIRISCLLPHDEGERALRTVHDAFGLGDAGGSVTIAPVTGVRKQS